MRNLDVIIKNSVNRKLKLIKELDDIETIEELKIYIQKLKETISPESFVIASSPSISYGNEIKLL